MAYQSTPIAEPSPVRAPFAQKPRTSRTPLSRIIYLLYAEHCIRAARSTFFCFVVYSCVTYPRANFFFHPLGPKFKGATNKLQRWRVYIILYLSPPPPYVYDTQVNIYLRAAEIQFIIIIFFSTPPHTRQSSRAPQMPRRICSLPVKCFHCARIIASRDLLLHSPGADAPHAYIRHI